MKSWLILISSRVWYGLSMGGYASVSAEKIEAPLNREVFLSEESWSLIFLGLSFHLS